MSTENGIRPSAVFPTVFELIKGSPIVGQLANDLAVDENFTEIYELIKGKITTNISKPIIICIDGRGGSGKSTIATKLLTNLKDSLLVELDCFPTKGGLYVKGKY